VPLLVRVFGVDDSAHGGENDDDGKVEGVGWFEFDAGKCGAVVAVNDFAANDGGVV
jgi:hypothetical protein